MPSLLALRFAVLRGGGGRLCLVHRVGGDVVYCGSEFFWEGVVLFVFGSGVSVVDIGPVLFFRGQSMMREALIVVWVKFGADGAEHGLVRIRRRWRRM